MWELDRKESCDKPRQYIKRQTDHFADKGPHSQSYGFSSRHVQVWELDHKEGWMSKNWCFSTVGWRRLLRVPWTSRRSNQSILKEISPEYSWKGLMLKLNLQYFGYLMRRTNSMEKAWCWERLKAGEGDDRGWDGWMALPTRWTWVWASSGRWWRTGKPGVLQSMWLQRIGHDWATEKRQQCLWMCLHFP